MAGALAACSEPQSQDDSSLARDLDLALTQHSANAAVVSQIEAGVQKPKPRAPATRGITRVARARAHASHSRAEPSPAPTVDEAAPQPVEEVAAASPAPEPVEQPQSTREPEPEPVQTGRDGGRWPIPGDIGVRIPGGGVIIIRGGAGSGNDPCVRDHPGRGGRGGGVLINPPFPGLPGGGGFPGGVILR